MAVPTAGLPDRLGTGWRTVWEAVKPLLQMAADSQAQFEGVTTLCVDEHVWHHVSTKLVEDGGRGSKELTGMVDLTRHADEDGNLVVRARLLDLVPDCSGKANADWLAERGQGFRDGVQDGGTEGINGLIELHRRIARDFRNRDNYRLRMPLSGGGLDHSPHTQR